MRQIKFRAWTGNRMIDFEELKHGGYTPWNSTSLIWMQFTGLFDKNGKEIWEGDVVLIPSEEKDVVIAETGEGPIYEYPQLLPVVFENGAFGINPEPDYLFTNRFHTFRDIEDVTGQIEFEVIGDIYSTPELLS